MSVCIVADERSFLARLRDVQPQPNRWYGTRASVWWANHSPLEGESQNPSRPPELVEGPATADAVRGIPTPYRMQASVMKHVRIFRLSLTLRSETPFPTEDYPLILNLVKTFLELGDATSRNLEFSHRQDVFVSYGEETITEHNLLEIRRRHRKRICLETFPKRKEAQNGADWEWHIVGNKWTLKMRVQAKRARYKGRLHIKVQRAA